LKIVSDKLFSLLIMAFQIGARHFLVIAGMTGLKNSSHYEHISSHVNKVTLSLELDATAIFYNTNLKLTPN